MKILLTPLALYATFAVAASVELYFFAMQRSSLEISRAAEIDPRVGRMMLPPWYLLLWPARLLKWGAAIAIGITIHWGGAIGLLAIPFVLAIIVPIPHRHFLPFFRKRVRADLAQGENVALFATLDAVLDHVEEQLNTP